MKDKLKTGFAERLSAAAVAKRALLEKMRPRAAVADPQHAERAEMRQAELRAVREGRTAAKAAKREAAAEAQLEQERFALAAETDALLLKRSERKERKALTAAEAKAKRDAKYAARKARA